jgi:hypothetical protein
MVDNLDDDTMPEPPRELRRLDGGRYGDKTFDRAAFYRAVGWQMPA